jgi:hypothetical protein
MSSLFSRTAVVISIAGAIEIWASALPASAAAINFSTWSASGNVSAGVGSASLLTNPNSTNALDSTLQFFLGLNPEELDISISEQATQGSALTSFFNAGDTVSFNYNFAVSGSDLDYAFVVNNGGVERLLGITGTYTKTFTTAGIFGIGTVDVEDVTGPSVLSLSNANFQAVPSPALLPGLVGLGVSVLRKRKTAAQ